jgi:hypothetical protein
MGTDAMLRSARLAYFVVSLLPLGIIGCDDEEKLAFTAEVAVSAGGSGGSSGSGGQGGAGGVGGAGGKAGSTCTGKPSSTDTAYKTPVGLGQPPPPTPGAAGPVPGAVSVQAFRVLLLGEADPDGTANPEAWKQYGFDIDGWSSDVGFCGHCKPVGGARKPDIFVDGEHGIDNGFGKNIVNGIIATLTPNPTDSLNESIAKGLSTTLLRIHGLAQGGDQVGLTAELFTAKGGRDSEGGVVSPTKQQWQDGSYAWHPLGEQVSPDGSSSMRMENSYIAGDVWVSGGESSFALDLNMSGYLFTLKLHRARMMGKLSADRRTVAEGNISGIVAPEEFVADLKSNDPNYWCEGFSYDDLLAKIRGASDILDDGTQDPSRDCNGISVGLGFVSAPASLGTPTPKSPPPHCGGP